MFWGCDVTFWLDPPPPMSHFVRFLANPPMLISAPEASDILFAWPLSKPLGGVETLNDSWKT